MPRILVSEDISGVEMDALRREFDVALEFDLWKSFDKLKATIADFDALMVRNQTPVNAELIAAGKKLSVIGRAGVGLDNIDAAAATKSGIVVVYAPEQNAISVAELALGMMLGLARMIPAADRSTKARKWERKRFVGTELYGKTHLLSISIDPEYDTPKVLRSYGAAHTERYQNETFAHWEFAGGTKEQVKEIAQFFGLTYIPQQDQIIHALRTVIIDSHGKVTKIYSGNDWKVDEVVEQLKKN